MSPSIVNKEEIMIAGICGSGNNTGGVWQEFEELNEEIGLNNKISDNGYEVRFNDEKSNKVHVGNAVSNSDIAAVFSLIKLPASQYVSFEVHVENGYDSENNAIDKWLAENSEIYTQRLFDGRKYIVEYYDERFNGDEPGSIVEIWIPIEKVNHHE